MWSSMLRAYNIADELEKLGWSCLVLHMRLGASQRRRLLRLFAPDIVFVQQCRHPLNRIEHLGDLPIVLDMDDADFLEARMVPLIEPVAIRARGVIGGSRFIRDWAAERNPNTTVIWTGTPVSPSRPPPQAGRKRVVTWAQAAPLGYVAEFALVHRIMRDVAQRSSPFIFRLYGWDAAPSHPYVDDLRSLGIEVEILPFMPYSDFLRSLRDVSVGLSPIVPVDFSRGKSFGKILAYLDAGVPVVCSDEADHSLFFTRESGVVTNDHEVWVDAICGLLADPARRQAMVDAAHERFVTELSIEAAARRVDAFLRPLLSAAPNLRTGN